MPSFPAPLPLSLYIHIPWCVRKCPYCDFNSHTAKDNLQEELYVAALIRNLQFHLPLIQDRPIISIFFGGGTPSLFSGKAIENILSSAKKYLTFMPDIEITLEANPGTIDYVKFQDFYAAGINRLSLGVQSFQNDKLNTLGRIHNENQAQLAIDYAKQAGFNNFNIDLMYGLPDQTLEECLADLTTAIACQPTHLSWYQLTIEPNTFFHRHPPKLPEDDLIWQMQLAGQEVLQNAGLHQYEVSAYAQLNHECRHNLNYWQFGDYLGIGAGAHSKMTDLSSQEAKRFFQLKNPKDYLQMFSPVNHEHYQAQNEQVISDDAMIFEFMLNALRLTNGFETKLFCERTGLGFDSIKNQLSQAARNGLVMPISDWIRPSKLGNQFLNNLTEMFL